MIRPVQVTLDVGQRSLSRFIELEGFDRSMALAGQAFAALMPLLIVVSAVTPGGGKDLASELIDRFDLTGGAADSLRAAVAQPAAVESSISFVSGFILVVSALSFTRALQRLYVRAWRLPKLGVAGNAWGLAWLVGFSLYWTLAPAIGRLSDGPVLPLVLSTGLWLFTPWILVGKRITWQRLVPQAVLTACSIAVFGVASLLYLPHAVSTAASQFGVIGVAFSLLSWLFVFSLIVVVAAALGATVAEAGRRPTR